jgi:hypothetical protein
MQRHAFQAADLPSFGLKEHSAANPLRKPHCSRVASTEHRPMRLLPRAAGLPLAAPLTSWESLGDKRWAMTRPDRSVDGPVVFLWRYSAQSILGGEFTAVLVDGRGVPGNPSCAVLDRADGVRRSRDRWCRPS